MANTTAERNPPSCEAGIGFGYVMNKMDLGIAGDPRTSALIDALYGCL